RWPKRSLAGRQQRQPRPAPDVVFVLTYGRSGSTLLQAILNATPGVLIRGENRGITHLLYEFHATAVKEGPHVKHFARRPFNPWFGMYDFPAQVSLDRIRALVTDTLLRPGPDTRLTGFKEIRWDHDDLAEFVAFLREVFPGARFIVNTRRHEDVARSMAKSGWWPEVDDPLAHVARAEERIRTVARDLGDDAHEVCYDDYVAAPEALRGLFDWLGVPFDLDRVTEVIQARTYAPS
ncbi:MAG TPA: sulfotransferase, partial [Marmoricola sp.]|nr:sulfotransferase [Marmoricola sp.]